MSAPRPGYISTDRVVRYLKRLRDSYLVQGRQEDAAETERFTAEFLARYGSEIPVREAHDLMKEMERRVREAEAAERQP